MTSASRSLAVISTPNRISIVNAVAGFTTGAGTYTFGKLVDGNKVDPMKVIMAGLGTAIITGVTSYFVGRYVSE